MVTANSASTGTAFYARGLDAGQVCAPVGGCVPGEVVDHVVVLVWAGIVTLALLAALQHIRQARSAAEEERTRAEAERDAFDRFARRLAHVEAGSPGVPETTGGETMLARSAEDPALEQIRDAYRETVMAVPHYDEEYDEPAATNMAAEFGEEVTTAVLNGPQFTPGLKQALLGKAAESRQQREELLAALDREERALSEAAAVVGDVDATLREMNERPLADRSFDDLARAHDRLDDLEGDVGRVVIDRQGALNEDFEVGSRATRSHAFHEYLYQSLPVTYPVLADATTQLSRIREAKDAVARTLTTRA